MEIWVTLLTIAGALVGTWLTTWLVGRQAAKDLRSNISREIEILGKLRPESDEAKLLDANIRINIKDLAAQDDHRRWRAQQDYSTVNGQLKLPVGGHENCPLVANKNCPVADTNLPMRVSPPPVVEAVVSSRV